MLDIGSKNSDIEYMLSNFSFFYFVFDDVICHSMEGFLQSLKFEDPEEQKKVCLLFGSEAKFKGKKKNWMKDQTLYWKGRPIKRDSEDYQIILINAFVSLSYNEEFKYFLTQTKSDKLKHSVGKSNQRYTVLTEKEFIKCLDFIRRYKYKQI